MKKEMTDWFPEHTDPIHIGVYEVLPFGNHIRYAYWSGKVWSYFDEERIPDEEFLLDIDLRYTHDSLVWRGFKEPQQ